MTLVRNEGWNGHHSEYDQIQLVPIGDLNTAQIAFEAGDLDMTKINISAIGKYRDDPGDNTLTVRPALAYSWLGMNVDHPKLKDLQVRRAIQQAIDVPAILDATFGGAVKPAYGLVPPPGARSKNLYPYDPAQAKALLQKPVSRVCSSGWTCPLPPTAERWPKSFRRSWLRWVST
ncbi:hypothetical protein SODG_003689 [Sodalis praecaptivus]